MAEMKKKKSVRRINRKVGDWVNFATGHSKYRIIRINEEARTADLQLPHGAIYEGKRLSRLYSTRAPDHDLERMRKAQQEHYVESQAKSRLDHSEMYAPMVHCDFSEIEDRSVASLVSPHNAVDDINMLKAMEEARKTIMKNCGVTPMQLGAMIHPPIHNNCRSISIPMEEIMNNVNEVVNKLNGRTKGVDLEQAVAEDKTIKVCLHTILKNCKQVKDLKLGEKAVLTGLNFQGDHFAFTISEGAVEKVENESQF